jgi:hypothetical protein
MTGQNNPEQRDSDADLVSNHESAQTRPIDITEERYTDPSTTPSQPASAEIEPPGSLFDEHAANELRMQWEEVQTGFVDDPRGSVAQADQLVAATLKEIANAFAQERIKLEQQWDHGDAISTEDLRVILQRYRAFFHRLLSI